MWPNFGMGEKFISLIPIKIGKKYIHDLMANVLGNHKSDETVKRPFRKACNIGYCLELQMGIHPLTFLPSTLPKIALRRLLALSANISKTAQPFVVKQKPRGSIFI